MPRLEVQSTAHTRASADQTWAVVRNFCAPWHPDIAEMHPERGGLIRRFQLSGEPTIYRERLTYFSASEREMAYSHLDGIAGVTQYTARLTVRPTGTGATVTLHAELTAPDGRAQQIASGTQTVFDRGVAEIATRALTQKRVGPLQPREDTAPPLNLHRISAPPALAVSTSGIDSDTLVLFLHGIGGNRSNWDAQLAALAPFARVAALDLRGYGDSALGPEPTTIDAYCNDILRVAQAFGAKRLVLCGLSYGAWIATSFAMRHPAKLTGLVLSGGCTGMSEASPAERAAFLSDREIPLNAGQNPADFAASVVEVIAGPSATAAQRAALTASMAAIPSATYKDALHCFTNPPETFDFKAITCPVLLMTGEFDRLAPPSELQSVARRIWHAQSLPDVRFEVIPGAGHVCNLENSSKYNAILTEFASRVLA